jgi:Alpha/beta hydrolase domain
VQLLMPARHVYRVEGACQRLRQGRALAASSGTSFRSHARAQRLSRGDPRPSLEERDGTHAAYVDRVRSVSASQVAARFLLPADADKLVAQASTVLN